MKTKMISRAKSTSPSHRAVLNVIVILFAKTEICILLPCISRLVWNSHCLLGWPWTPTSISWVLEYHYTWESNQRLPAHQVSTLPMNYTATHCVYFIWPSLENEDKIGAEWGKKPVCSKTHLQGYKERRNGTYLMLRIKEEEGEGMEKGRHAREWGLRRNCCSLLCICPTKIR